MTVSFLGLPTRPNFPSTCNLVRRKRFQVAGTIDHDYDVSLNAQQIFGMIDDYGVPWCLKH